MLCFINVILITLFVFYIPLVLFFPWIIERMLKFSTVIVELLSSPFSSVIFVSAFRRLLFSACTFLIIKSPRIISPLLWNFLFFFTLVIFLILKSILSDNDTIYSIYLSYGYSLYGISFSIYLMVTLYMVYLFLSYLHPGFILKSSVTIVDSIYLLFIQSDNFCLWSVYSIHI